MTTRRHALLAMAMAHGAVAAAPNSDPGASGAELLLGHTGVLSGPLGVPVRAVLAGAELAFGQVNAAGGIHGRRVRLETLDDELKPEKAVANYQVLLEERRVLACFGCVGSGTTAAAADLLQASGTPLVACYAVADSARRKVAGSAYFVRAGTGREAQALAQHLSTLGIERIGFVHLDNPGGTEATALMSQALAARRLKLAKAVAVKPDGTNAATAGPALAAAEPQAVVMYLGGDLPAQVMRSLWDQGLAPSFYGMSIVAGDVVARALGGRMRGGLAVSQVIPYPWSQAEGAAREFRRVAEAAGVPVGYLTYEGYVNALVMIEALRLAGRDPTRARLHTALRGMKLRLAGMEIDFTDREALAGSRLVDLVFVGKDGHFTR